MSALIIANQQVPDRVTFSGGFDTPRSYAVQVAARVEQRDLNPLVFSVRRDAARLFNVRARWQRAQFVSIADRLQKLCSPEGMLWRLADSLKSNALRPIFARTALLLSPLLQSLDTAALAQELAALQRTPERYMEIVGEMFQNDVLFVRTISTICGCASPALFTSLSDCKTLCKIILLTKVIVKPFAGQLRMSR